MGRQLWQLMPLDHVIYRNPVGLIEIWKLSPVACSIYFPTSF